MKSGGTIYLLELRSLPESWRPEPWMRLRAVLKVLKRGYGFECMRCEEKLDACQAEKKNVTSTDTDEKSQNP